MSNKMSHQCRPDEACSARDNDLHASIHLVRRKAVSSPTRPKVVLGKPVTRGTRITLELILRKLGEGATPSGLLDPDPHLTEDDIQAAIMCAADTPTHEQRVVVEGMRFLAD